MSTVAETSAEPVLITLPSEARPLPTAADFARISACPIVQLVVVGRSGSSLVHAFLDGHPQLLHVPHTFKFYDFMASDPTLSQRSAAEVVERFVTSPLVAHLLESNRSVIIGGRLGPQMAVYNRFDLDQFRRAFVSATAGAAMTERNIFVGLVIAFGWCAGQDLSRTKVVFQHLHHGDWLFPERLLEKYNYTIPRQVPATGSLRADKFILSVRAPYDAYLAYVKFTSSHGLADPARLDLQQQFTRLLLQDWDRLAHIVRSGLDYHVVRIEDLRQDAARAMQACARWLGLDQMEECLNHLTYYNYAWHGDIYTEPSTTVHQVRPSRPIAWQERWLCDALLGSEARNYGYRLGSSGWLKWRLLPLTVWWPAAGLFDATIESWRERYKAAADRARADLEFVTRLARQWPR